MATQPQHPAQSSHQRHRSGSIHTPPSSHFHMSSPPSSSVLSLLFLFLFSSSLFQNAYALPFLRKAVSGPQAQGGPRDSTLDLGDLKARAEGQGHVIDLAAAAPASHPAAAAAASGGERSKKAADEEMNKYLEKLNRMEYEEIMENLANLLSADDPSGVSGRDQESSNPNQPSESGDAESRLLNRIQQYEDLRSMVKEFSGPDNGDIMREDLDFDDDAGEEDGEWEGRDYPDADHFRKRTELIDKEDDWLSGDYYGEPEVDANLRFLSSRRRIYPNYEDGEDKIMPADPAQSRLESSPEIHLTKKDLESLIYQANPALTVHELSAEPEIAFRKFQFSEDKGGKKKEEEEKEKEKTANGGAIAATAPPAPAHSIAQHKRHENSRMEGARRGMLEFPMLRPAAGTLSPVDRFAEEQELRRLSKSIPKKQLIRDKSEEEEEEEKKSGN